MCAFNPTDRAPGVYIEEVQLLGPIPGVGTNIAAFVGPARSGPMNDPRRLTNWTQFTATFGAVGTLDPYFPSPDVYVTTAVKGFFDNGGSDCWFVRVGSAVRASLDLVDRSAAHNPTMVVIAKTEGVVGDGVTVAVADASLANTAATRAATTLAAPAAIGDVNVRIQAADATSFMKGDVVEIEDGANSEPGTVMSITGATITLAAPLGHVHAAGTTLRIADLAVGQTVIRVNDVAKIEAGSNVSLTQGGNTESGVVDAVDGTAKRLTLARGLQNPYTMDAAAAAVDIATQEFSLTVVAPNTPAESYTGLSLDPRHSRYFSVLIDSPSVDVGLADDPPNPTPAPDNIPAVLPATHLANGADDNVGAITANEFKNGIDKLRTIDAVNMLCVPDRTDLDVQSHMVAHCELMQDRFAILDPIRNADPTTITAQRDALNSDRGFAALYYPRLRVSDPRNGGLLTVPPSGHVAGLYARVDDARGVFKAPANEPLLEVLDLERALDDNTQGPLNEDGINVIRRFPGRGIRVWGARTISKNTQWRYVNVRRLLLFIEESIQEGTQFVVFEPNEPSLWQQVKREVSEFLTRQWSAGALVGATAADSFEVLVNTELNPPESMALGMLVTQVTVYPAPPAEFVVFRIISVLGGKPQVQE